MSQRSPLNHYAVRRLWTRRLVAAGIAAGVILLRVIGCHEDLSTSKPAAGGIDDFSRYHDQTVTCVKVLDGDTIHVDVPDLKDQDNRAYTRIRFWGIDTPEISHGKNKPAMYFGYEATEFARKHLAGKKVRLELVEGKTRDRYGRLLAYIHLSDGSMYNRQALAQGFAYADYRFKHPYREEFFELEASARKNLAGLWKQVLPEQLPSWYKKSNLKGFWQARDEGKTFQEPPAAPTPQKNSKPQPKKSITW